MKKLLLILLCFLFFSCSSGKLSMLSALEPLYGKDINIIISEYGAPIRVFAPPILDSNDIPLTKIYTWELLGQGHLGTSLDICKVNVTVNDKNIITKIVWGGYCSSKDIKSTFRKYY